MFSLVQSKRKILLSSVKYILFDEMLFLVQIKILPLHTEKNFTKLLAACGSVLGGIERDIIDSHNKESKMGGFKDFFDIMEHLNDKKTSQSQKYNISFMGF